MRYGHLYLHRLLPGVELVAVRPEHEDGRGQAALGLPSVAPPGVGRWVPRLVVVQHLHAGRDVLGAGAAREGDLEAGDEVREFETATDPPPDPFADIRQRLPVVGLQK